MSFCTPGASEIERLVGVLEAYDRDELLLRASQIFSLETQPVQIAFDAIDPDGAVLRDVNGVERNHTLQVFSTSVQMVPGQRMHLSRAGDEIRLQILPLDSDQASREHHESSVLLFSV